MGDGIFHLGNSAGYGLNIYHRTDTVVGFV